MTESSPLKVGAAAPDADPASVVDVEDHIPSGRPWWGYIEEGIISVILGAILLVTATGVVSRHLFDAPLPWTEPLARYLLIWLTMAGAAVLIKNRANIQIDFIYEMLSARWKTVLEVLTIVMQLCAGIYLLVYGWELVSTTTARTSVPFVSLGVVYFSVPISAVLIIGYSVRDAFNTISRARKATS